ncbi:MAG: AAA family ATPase [Candidatus Diapherotrites archaeon]|nr:AAA family ATPase [Candidatus Diapherotrites archaeon]
MPPKRLFRRKRPTDIAIVGIDGAGKTTLARGLQSRLNAQGTKTAVLDVPHFQDYGGMIGRVSGFGRSISAKGAEKQSKRLAAAGGAIASLPTRMARAKSRKSTVRIIERHPAIEAPVLARQYGGRIILAFSKAAGRIAGGPLPDVAVFLSVEPATAAERLAKKRAGGSGLHAIEFQHEKPENLEGLNSAYQKRKAELASKGVWILEIDASLPKEAVLGQVQRILKEKRLMEKGRKKYLERKKEQAMQFMVDGIWRWEKEGRIGQEKAAELREKIGKGYFSDFLTHFGVHLAISGVPVIMAGVGTVGRPAYTAAMRGIGMARRLAGNISAEEYEKIKRLHSGEAMLIGAIPFAGRTAYIVSSIVREPEMMGILADHFAYKKLGRLYGKYNVSSKVETITRGAKRYLEWKISIEKKVKAKLGRRKK